MSKKCFKSLFLIALGCALTAFGIINFAVINQLGDGGFTGVTLILYHSLGISPAFSNLLLNIPMFILAYRQFDKKDFNLTIFGTLTLSFFLWIFELIGPLVPSLENDLIIAAVGYGVFLGAGIGLIFRENATTGGFDIAAKIVKDKLDFPVAHTLFAFDTFVIICSLFTFLTFSNSVYTIIGFYIYSQLIPKFQEGFHSGYKVLIISDHYQEITALIQKNLNRNATFLNGTSAFTKENRKVILIIISKKQLIYLKRIIYDVDPLSFVSVCHVYETLGRGFTFENKESVSID